MIDVPKYIFFESEQDFAENCELDPYGRGWEYDRHPIKQSADYPAAYELIPDFDPRCVGSYRQVNFVKAAIEAIDRNKEQIAQLKAERASIQASLNEMLGRNEE